MRGLSVLAGCLLAIIEVIGKKQVADLVAAQAAGKLKADERAARFGVVFHWDWPSYLVERSRCKPVRVVPLPDLPPGQ